MNRGQRFSSELAERSIDVDGRQVLYQVTGSGEPLVLVHGLSGSSRWWWRNIPALAEHYRVYLVDLPGFGVMRRDQAGFALAEAAEWLAAWVRAMEIGPVHLIAHSLGGFISVRMAAKYPDLVASLVLVSPAGVPQERPIIAYSIPLLRAATQLRPRFAAVLARDFLRAGPRTVLRAARDLLSDDIRGDLRVIDAPTLLIWGEDDPMVPVSVSDAFRSEIKRSRLVIIPGTGHVPMIDRSTAFNRAVLDFLAGEKLGK